MIISWRLSANLVRLDCRKKREFYQWKTKSVFEKIPQIIQIKCKWLFYAQRNSSDMYYTHKYVNRNTLWNSLNYIFPQNTCSGWTSNPRERQWEKYTKGSRKYLPGCAKFMRKQNTTKNIWPQQYPVDSMEFQLALCIKNLISSGNTIKDGKTKEEKGRTKRTTLYSFLCTTLILF